MFSIDLKKAGRQVKGQYCAVDKNGNKADCDGDKNPNIIGVLEKSEQSANIKFSRFFGAKDGDAVLKVDRDRLTWHIIKSPVGGEFYAPQNAVLDRH